MIADAMFWIAAGGVLVSCLSAMGTRALREYSRHDLEELCQRRRRSERFSVILRDDDRVALGVEMIAILGTVFTSVSAVLWAQQRFSDSPFAGASALMLITLGVGLVAAVVWIPWSVSRLEAARLLYHTWPLWKLLYRLAIPLMWGAHLVDMIFHRIAGRVHEKADEESFEEEIRTIVSEGHREGLLEEEAREMIEGVIELGDAHVSEIMTPRTDVQMLQVNLPWEELLDVIIRSGHTRIPVYDKSRDDIIGILYSKDLLPELTKRPGEPHKRLPDLLRKPLFVPETKPVDDLLRMFQQTHTHIAVVLDEYGGVSGLVTIEDVLEEIVGEIVDEYDKDVEEEIRKLDDGICEALGRAHVDEINEVMGLELPEEEDFDTIGGFVFSELGRVPLVGEKVTWQDSVQVTVLAATRRRIDRVRIERVPKDSREIA